MTEVVGVAEESVEDLDAQGQVAILTLAWALRRNVNDRYVLSATIELCNPGAVEDFDGTLHRTKISDAYFAFFRRYSLSGAEGLAWFKGCAGGNAQLPQIERALISRQQLTHCLADA